MRYCALDEHLIMDKRLRLRRFPSGAKCGLGRGTVTQWLPTILAASSLLRQALHRALLRSAITVPYWHLLGICVQPRWPSVHVPEVSVLVVSVQATTLGNR